MKFYVDKLKDRGLNLVNYTNASHWRDEDISDCILKLDKGDCTLDRWHKDITISTV